MKEITKKIIRKYYEFIITKVKILFSQRVFTDGKVCVKYMYKSVKNSKGLVIVFSACTRKEIKARYNYVKTLNGLECNRLYILDDWGADQRGSYYLGENFEFTEEVATNLLIDKFIAMQKKDKVIFCGSSKGGYAALNFGLQRMNALIVAGGPQYHLYQYLRAGCETTLEHIMGNYSDEKAIAIDNHLKNQIENDLYANTQSVFLHYSNQEHTYVEHICDLIKDLSNKGISLEQDVADYTEHSAISLFFPDYLRKKISEII